MTSPWRIHLGSIVFAVGFFLEDMSQRLSERADSIMRRAAAIDPEAASLERLQYDANKKLHPNGWSCHFCGRWRPDEMISTTSADVDYGLFAVHHSRRYCNDKEECRDAAIAWAERVG